MRVAIVHDWLTNQGGSERVVWALHEAFPDAPIYTSAYNAEALPQFSRLDVRTTFLQRMPRGRTRHQWYPLLRRYAFELFDFSEYDVVVSSASAEAKGIITKPETLHVCYCHTPTRYFWSGYQEYLESPGLGRLGPAVRIALPVLIGRMRVWDFAAAQRVDAFVANSANTRRKIEKYYRRDAHVIHPPVDDDRFTLNQGPRRGMVVASRLVPYKRVDLAVQACTELGIELTVVGDGSEMAALREMAGPTIRFAGWLTDAEVAEQLASAEALLFPADEDFGITPVEAMACGTPVIAFGRGGATETVVEGETGTFFAEQEVASVKQALRRFAAAPALDPVAIRRHAESFGRAAFIAKVRDFVAERRQALAGGPLRPTTSPAVPDRAD